MVQGRDKLIIQYMAIKRVKKMSSKRVSHMFVRRVVVPGLDVQKR
jgi:hypothetical protein